jgi:acetyl esterase/lipase
MSIGLQLAALRHFMSPLRRAGIETWYPWLPAHGPRTPEGSLSGVECLSSDLAGTARNVARAVHETIELATWLGARGHRVAILGFSLGGWIAALAATEFADFDRVVLYTPVVDPARAFDQSPLVRHIRDDLAAAGISREDAAALMARVAPCRRSLRTPAGRVLIVGATEDNVVAPDSLREVRAHWECELTWLSAGHITSQWSPSGRRQARAWLGEVAR